MRTPMVMRFGRSGLALALVAAVGLGAGVVGAQEDEPTHPAHIHAGTCAELGDVVFPLTDVGAVGGMMAAMAGTPEAATPAAMAGAIGAGSAVPVETSYTLVDADLATIAEGGHAINVHLSADEIGTYIACGDIGGTVLPGMGGQDGVLLIGLRELNGSGYSGVAALQEMGTRTGITIFLAQGLTTAATGGAATPTAAASPVAAAEEVAVTIQNFAYTPAEVTIPVGGTVTWTNQDPVPHTATGFEGADFQSGTLNQGESFSHTFAEAGTYQYRCEFHAGMLGTVIVE